MEFYTINCGKILATVNVSKFIGKSGVEEYHFIIRPTDYGTIETQLGWVHQAYLKTLESLKIKMSSSVFRRFYCSDLMNQSDVLKSKCFSQLHNMEDPCAVSWICQPSVPPVKVSMWAYHIHDSINLVDKVREDASFILNRGPLSHHWTTGLTCLSENGSQAQTRGIFEKYQTFLQVKDMTLAENLVRTWFFVQNIDANYKGLVVARREYFAEHGLTPQTHFIASTGIEGSYAEVGARVTLDAYAISGLHKEQVKYLSAPRYLSPTHIYGVTFERGTSISYQDRKQIYISGTASIDAQGNILYPGDIVKQLQRTLENVEALLHQSGAQLKDMGVMIVYVRDYTDFGIVRELLKKRFGEMPMETIVAPVCRPGWLIEIEGQATISQNNPKLPEF